MPKKKKGKRQNANKDVVKRELVFKDDGQEYAQAVRMLGNGRLEALCFDGRTRLAIIRGKMRKRVWVNAGDIILVGLRDFQDDKCDVMQKYSSDEARLLKTYGELPDTAKINEDEQFGDSVGECAFEFTDDVDSEDTKTEMNIDEGGVDLDEI